MSKELQGKRKMLKRLAKAQLNETLEDLLGETNDSEEEANNNQLPNLNHLDQSDNSNPNDSDASSESRSDDNDNDNDNDHFDSNANEPQPTLPKKLDFDTKVDGIPYISMKGKKIPSYQKMITEAIETLNEKKGSSFMAIKKWIIANYPDAQTPRLAASVKKAITKGIESGLFYHPKETSNSLARLKLVKKPIRSKKANTKVSKEVKHKDDKGSAEDKVFKDAEKILKAKKPAEKVLKKNTKVAADEQQPEKTKVAKAKKPVTKEKKATQKVPNKTKKSTKKTLDKENVEKSEVSSTISKKPKALLALKK